MLPLAVVQSKLKLAPVDEPVQLSVVVAAEQDKLPFVDAAAFGGVVLPVMVPVADFVQPALSVVVTVYGPVAVKLAIFPVWPFDHSYENGGVPPPAVAVTLTLWLTQLMVPPGGAVRVMAGGAVIVTDEVADPLPLEPVTVTE